jgi:hypothetical protein
MRDPVLALLALVTLVGCGSAETSVTTAAPETETETEAATETAPERRSEEPTQSAVLAGSRSDPRRPENPETETGTETGTETATAAPVGPHEVVVVAVHDDPLLRSEQRLLDVIEERMQMRRIDAIEREASEEEASFARAFFAGQGQGTPPASLSGASVVVFLRFPPNRELDRGQRATRGLGGVVAFRAGEPEPFFEARIDDVSAWRAADEQIWPWLISLVRAEVAS